MIENYWQLISGFYLKNLYEILVEGIKYLLDTTIKKIMKLCKYQKNECLVIDTLEHFLIDAFLVLWQKS